MISRYTTDISSGDIFSTDSNGRGLIQRQRNKRQTWTLNITEPVSANYYPVVSRSLPADQDHDQNHDPDPDHDQDPDHDNDHHHDHDHPPSRLGLEEGNSVSTSRQAAWLLTDRAQGGSSLQSGHYFLPTVRWGRGHTGRRENSLHLG